MEEDISHIAADSHDSENMPSTSKKPDSVEVDARDDFFDSLIEAEINASTTEENADAPEEMLVEDSLNLSEELKETSIEDSENRNASETPVTEIDVNDTDGHEAEELPDSVSKDDEFVKPKNVLCHFPLGRIKRIVKSDPEVPVISAESLFLISKSTVSKNCLLQFLTMNLKLCND